MANTRQGRHGAAQRSVFGFWVPLIVASSLAIGGLAAWVWAERNEDDDDYLDDASSDKPSRPTTSGAQPYSEHSDLPPYQGPLPSQSAGPQGAPPPPAGGEAAEYYNPSRSAPEGSKSAISSQKDLGQMSRRVSAGIARAGNALGGMTGNKRDERDGRDERGSRKARGGRHDEVDRRDGFSDQEHWSKEAEGRSGAKAAVVVGETDEDASLLKHIASVYDRSRAVELLVLIYSPALAERQKETPLRPMSPRPDAEEFDLRKGSVVHSVYNQAKSLVRDESIIPFTTPEGYVHLLRHLTPQCVYLGSSWKGADQKLKGWVGKTFIVGQDVDLDNAEDHFAKTVLR